MYSLGIFWKFLRNQHRNKRQHHNHHAVESPSTSTENRCSLHCGRRITANTFGAADYDWHVTRPGHFVVERRLGSGGFGNVFQAVDDVGRRVALKAIDRHITLGDPYLWALLYREVFHHSQLIHRNIARLRGVIEDKNYFILVQELANRGDLLHYMQRLTKRLSESQVKHFILDILRALAHSHHRGIVHADVKPENVLVCVSRLEITLKLSDFGCSLSLTNESHANEWRGAGGLVGHTGDDEELGTAEFRAPEIWDGKPCGFKVDTWALGIMTYEMVCGFLPFNLSVEPRRPQAIDLSFPPNVPISDCGKDFISRLLCESVDERLSSWEALQHEWFHRL